MENLLHFRTNIHLQNLFFLPTLAELTVSFILRNTCRSCGPDSLNICMPPLPSHTPVGDFQSSRWCELVTGGWLGCDSHSAEFFGVVSGGRASPPVSGPAGVPGSQGPVALLQVDGVQISIQLERDGARPALPGHGLTGLNLCRIGKRFI